MQVALATAQKSAILEVAQLQQSIFGGLDRPGLCFLDEGQFVDVDLGDLCPPRPRSFACRRRLGEKSR